MAWKKKHEEDECHQRDIFTKRTLWKLSFMFEMILSLFWWGRFERYWWWKKKRSHCCRLLFRQRQYKSDGYRFFSTIFILFTFLVFVCVFYFYFSDICCFSIYPKERKFVVVLHSSIHFVRFRTLYVKRITTSLFLCSSVNQKIMY